MVKASLSRRDRFGIDLYKLDESTMMLKRVDAVGYVQSFPVKDGFRDDGGFNIICRCKLS